MSSNPKSAISIRVDPTNPGQFFACCGLLDLADRLWDGAEGWFDEDGFLFSLRPYQEKAQECAPAALLAEITRCRLTNTMSDSELKRRDQLMAVPKKIIESDPSLEAEKKVLDKLWREAPLVLHSPFNIRVDWFLDEYSGGTMFKTWAGQQSVFEIGRGMKAALDSGDWIHTSPDDWLQRRMLNDSLPFNFDSELGGVGSDLDVGFSFDPLKTIKVQARPLLEFLAFVGLQRFRPMKINAENRFQYFLWFDPLVSEVAAPAACGLFAPVRLKAFEFRLLYRTKYLKSFLPATPIQRS